MPITWGIQASCAPNKFPKLYLGPNKLILCIKGELTTRSNHLSPEYVKIQNQNVFSKPNQKHKTYEAPQSLGARLSWSTVVEHLH